MNAPDENLYVGHCKLQQPECHIKGVYTNFQGEIYYCIRNFDQMPPFFMNLVSSSDQWMFISSTGGLTAGRRNAESSLFPYYTVDKITENAANTGHIALLRVKMGGQTFLWEPFSDRYRHLYTIQRNLYKNIYGNKLVFEEINPELNLIYRYSWQTSDKYGFVKAVQLTNTSERACEVNVLDGVQNILPYGATTALQTSFSNLLNGYKRNELEPETGVGMFTLSSTLTDLAEPSESLMATTLWQTGLASTRTLLSTCQVENFRRGLPVQQETDVRGRRGAYLVNSHLVLKGEEEKKWSFIADVNQDSTSVVSLIHELGLNKEAVNQAVIGDIDACTADLVTLVANADGLQYSADILTANHHFANVLYNIMRGGIFLNNHQVTKEDFIDSVRIRNRVLLDTCSDFFFSLPDTISVDALLTHAKGLQNVDVIRLSSEYLPLTFSRRHGDPSRPWNQFSINIKNPDGTRRLDYQGNWRDIFQNWEPLAYAYPGFVEGMICKFLNATTADGYNPYRITRDGIEWEVPSPDDPWANIGYWSDHQIIYLQKLLEISAKVHPEKSKSMLDAKIFSHANVPYRLKKYDDLLKNWYDTIEFDHALNGLVQERVAEIGTDGKLVLDATGNVFHVSMIEKLLSLLMAKMINFVPEGGIWMNTQRPEWNDANNALVGKGLSVVTLCYLRRFVSFFYTTLSVFPLDVVEVTQEIKWLFEGLQQILLAHKWSLTASINDHQRREIMDALGMMGSEFRWRIYLEGFSGTFVHLAKKAIQDFLALALAYIDHTISTNKRPDNLYHAYNILSIGQETAAVSHLYEMLEGQVAVLSSGLLSSADALRLLDSLKKSRMYRPDQHSYMLYPDRYLPGFLSKNTMTPQEINGSALLETLIEEGDTSLISKDMNGNFHFNGSFKNARDVERVLGNLKSKPQYTKLVEPEAENILKLFEKVFHHSEFTGRSGTFFAYEGLGSIYWHMVSKLLLAAQEVFFQAMDNQADQHTLRALADFYYDIREGIGFNKSPEVYGAFPTDPYSHTPASQGAKQPGMTGQVKEELMTRIGELGVFVNKGSINFDPVLLRHQEYLMKPSVFTFVDISGQKRTIDIPANALAFTFCQVPVIYMKGEKPAIEIHFSDETRLTVEGQHLSQNLSRHILDRDGYIKLLSVKVTSHLE